MPYMPTHVESKSDGVLKQQTLLIFMLIFDAL